MTPKLKCFQCEATISTGPGQTWMRDGRRYFHPNCFPAYLQAKNKQQHRGLPERLYAEVPPGLKQERLGACAQCGRDEWVHRAYWREAFIGAEHEFQPKENAS